MQASCPSAGWRIMCAYEHSPSPLGAGTKTNSLTASKHFFTKGWTTRGSRASARIWIAAQRRLRVAHQEVMCAGVCLYVRVFVFGQSLKHICTCQGLTSSSSSLDRKKNLHGQRPGGACAWVSMDLTDAQWAASGCTILPSAEHARVTEPSLDSEAHPDNSHRAASASNLGKAIFFVSKKSLRPRSTTSSWALQDRSSSSRPGQSAWGATRRLGMGDPLWRGGNLCTHDEHRSIDGRDSVTEAVTNSPPPA